MIKGIMLTFKKDSEKKNGIRSRIAKKLFKLFLPINYLERRRFQWLVTIFATTIVLFLGVWGYNDYDKQYNIKPNWSDNIYRSVCLLRLRVDERHKALATPDNPHSIPWQLHVTRIFLPIALLLFGFQSLAAFLRLDYRKKAVRRSKGHVILCGESEILEIVAKNFSEHGFKVAIVRPAMEINRGWYSHLEEDGIILVDGSPNDRTTLIRCGVRGARALIALDDSETRNLEILLKVKALLSRKKRIESTPLQGIARIHSLSFYQRMLASDMPPMDGKQISTRVFGESSITARMVWNDLSWYRQYLLTGKDTLHTVIFGFGFLGESLVLAICTQAYMCNIKNRIITIFDIDAEKREKSFLEFAPWVKNVCSIRFIKLDLIGVSQGNLTGIINSLEGPIPQLLYLCLGNDNTNFQCAMDLMNSIYNTPLAQTHIKIRILNKPNLITYLKEMKKKGLFLNISFFGGLDELYHPEVLLDEVTDTLAKEIHNHYSIAFNNKIEPWDGLSESLREANRQQADSIIPKMISRGYFLNDGKDRIGSQPLTQEDIDILAELEHERWVAERLSKGWTFGENRNNLLKTHPSIIDYDKLNAHEQEKDKNAVRSLFEVAESIGYKLVTERCVCLILAPDSDEKEALAFIERQCREARKIVLISPLISKLDHRVSQKALRKSNIRLFGLIPLCDGIPVYQAGTTIPKTHVDLLKDLEGVLYIPLPKIKKDFCDPEGVYAENAVEHIYSLLEERLDCKCWRS